MNTIQSSSPQPASQYRLVLTGTLFRRRGSRVTLSEEPPPPKPAPLRRPAKVARMLALAHHLQSAIERGIVADQATVARKLGLTRARVTQLFDLLLLAPDVQAAVLDLEAVDGIEPMSERALRTVARAGTWGEQRVFWAGFTDGSKLPSLFNRLDALTKLSTPAYMAP